MRSVANREFWYAWQSYLGVANKLAECALVDGVVLKDVFLVNALRKHYIKLCRGSCVPCKLSLYALACESGNAFRAGDDIPKFEIKKGYFRSSRLIVFQPLLGASLLIHSML